MMTDIVRSAVPVNRKEILPGDGESDYQREPPDPEEDALRLRAIHRKSRRTEGMRHLLDIMRRAGVDTETRDLVEDELFVKYSSVQLRRRNTTANGTIWTWKAGARRWIGSYYLPRADGEWVTVRNVAEIPWLAAAISTPQDKRWYRLEGSEQLPPPRSKRIVNWIRNTMKRALMWGRYDYAITADHRGIYFRWKKEHEIIQRIANARAMGRPAVERGESRPTGSDVAGDAGPKPTEQEYTPRSGPTPDHEPGAGGQKPSQRRPTWPTW